MDGDGYAWHRTRSNRGRAPTANTRPKWERRDNFSLSSRARLAVVSPQVIWRLPSLALVQGRQWSRMQSFPAIAKYPPVQLEGDNADFLFAVRCAVVLFQLSPAASPQLTRLGIRAAALDYIDGWYAPMRYAWSVRSIGVGQRNVFLRLRCRASHTNERDDSVQNTRAKEDPQYQSVSVPTRAEYSTFMGAPRARGYERQHGSTTCTWRNQRSVADHQCALGNDPKPPAPQRGEPAQLPGRAHPWQDAVP